MKSFETFLEEKYDEINSNSNNMNEEFENARDSWFENLDVQEVIDYGDEYAKDILDQVRVLVQKYTSPNPEFDGITFDTLLAKIK